MPSAAQAGMRVLFLPTDNRTDSNRTARSIDQLVVHVTEGSFVGSVRWLRSRRSHGSSHYVVSRRGEVVQLVSVTNVAWHAGNRGTNRRSIGIEHEGWTARGGFPEAQLDTSARLAAFLARRYGIPFDRAHVIGHHEVPAAAAGARRGRRRRGRARRRRARRVQRQGAPARAPLRRRPAGQPRRPPALPAPLGHERRGGRRPRAARPRSRRRWPASCRATVRGRRERRRPAYSLQLAWGRPGDFVAMP
jgi:hypothetical protein